MAKVEDKPTLTTAVCDWLRTGRNGPEARSAVLAGTRVDIFRSKDFFAKLREKPPPTLDALVPLDDSSSREPEKKIDLQIQRLGAKLLAAGLIGRVDRVIKERSKGRKHVKFPKTVEQHPNQQFMDGAFYCWRREAPRTLLSSVAPVLLVLAVFAVSFFPLAPYSVKISVVYAATGLLMLFFALSVARLILFVLIWVALGRNVWLFPNLYSEEIPITQILKPLIAESVPKKGEEPPSLGARLAFGLAFAATAVAVYHTVPEGTGVVSGMGAVNKGVLEMLNLHNGPKSIGDGNASDSSLSFPSSSGPQAPISAVAAAAAAAVKAGWAGPAGVPVSPAERLTEEMLANLAPVPEEEELEEPSAAAGEEEAAGQAGEGEAPAEGGAGAGETEAETAAEL